MFATFVTFSISGGCGCEPWRTVSYFTHARVFLDAIGRTRDEANRREIMSEKELASEACDAGLNGCVQKMADVLFQGMIAAKTPAEKQQAVQRFQNGLGIWKEAYQNAQQSINAVFP